MSWVDGSGTVRRLVGFGDDASKAECAGLRDPISEAVLVHDLAHTSIASRAELRSKSSIGGGAATTTP